MSFRDDSEEVRRMLDDRIEAVCDMLAPGWRRRGTTGYLTPKSAKDLGSFTVTLQNGGRMPRGSWYRFSQKIGGGSVELVSYLLSGRKDDYKTAFSWARDFLGIRREDLSDEDEAARDARRREQETARVEQRRLAEAERARDKERRTQTVRGIWDECRALSGTHGDAYLQARGLPPCKEWPWSPTEDIRFHPSLRYDTDRRFPAVVAAVRDSFGEITAIWRIYLDRDEPRKAPVDNAKVGLGPAAGGAVRIGGVAKKIGIGEGLETCLAAWALENFRYPVWAGLSTSGVASFEPPMEIERANPFPDGDYALLDKRREVVIEPPGMTAAKALRDRLVAAGLKSSINEMCLHGDALDLLITRRKYEQEHPDAP